jgi:hypothetical protein
MKNLETQSTKKLYNRERWIAFTTGVVRRRLRDEGGGTAAAD